MFNEQDMKIISNNPNWGDKIGLSWVFETKYLLEELSWLAEKLQEAKSRGYLPISIKTEDHFPFSHEGKTKIVVILENRKVILCR